MRKKTTCQKKFRKTKFHHNQYWALSYTECYPDGSQKDFKVFIKARSYLLSKEILKIKIKEDNPLVKIRALQGNMLHKDFRVNDKKLTIQNWNDIRSSAFPNVGNFLFKMEVERPEGYDHRLGQVDRDHLKTIGFKSGKDNWNYHNTKGKSLPESERAHKIYRGKWMDWDPQLRSAQLDKIIGALLKNGNCRSKAARELNVSRNKFYDLMEKFPEIDWAKDYSQKAFRSYAEDPEV